MWNIVVKGSLSKGLNPLNLSLKSITYLVHDCGHCRGVDTIEDSRLWPLSDCGHYRHLALSQGWPGYITIELLAKTGQSWYGHRKLIWAPRQDPKTPKPSAKHWAKVCNCQQKQAKVDLGTKTKAGPEDPEDPENTESWSGHQGGIRRPRTLLRNTGRKCVSVNKNTPKLLWAPRPSGGTRRSRRLRSPLREFISLSLSLYIYIYIYIYVFIHTCIHIYIYTCV